MDSFTQPTYSFTSEAVMLAGSARLAYIRKVYAYFSLALAAGIGGALIAMNSSLVYFFAEHIFIGAILFIGMAIFASASAGNPARALPTLFAFTFISGLFISPTLYAIAHGYIRGAGTGIIYD